MLVTKEGLPRMEGEAVLIKGDNAWAVVELQGGKNDLRAGDMMKIVGALEVKGKWCFREKHVAGVDNTLADLITRCKYNKAPNIGSQLARAGDEKREEVFRDVARGYVFASIRKACQGAW